MHFPVPLLEEFQSEAVVSTLMLRIRLFLADRFWAVNGRHDEERQARLDWLPHRALCS